MNAALMKYRYRFGIVIVIAAVIIYKLKFLLLPYFWDEAWPYSVAVRTLFNNGLSLLPGAIDADLSRGHPLMFHFLAALWMKIFGNGVLSGHSFVLAISVFLIVCTYLFCKKFFSERVGFIAGLLLSVQPLFITQSVFLMPEMLMALWTMLCLFVFFEGRKFLFLIFGTAMMLTKESGYVLPAILFIAEVFVFFFSKQKSSRSFLGKLLLICIPVFVASIFYILQKNKFGWFFYPFHMDHISSSLKVFPENLQNEAAYLFIYYGRNGISIFVIISLIWILTLPKFGFTQNEKKILPVLSLYIVLYLVFSALNFYIPRYLMCAFPPFIIIGSVLADKVFARFKLIYPLIITGIAVTCLFFYFQPKKYGDMDYSPSVNTDLQMVRYCEQMGLQDKKIFTTTLIRYALNEPYTGYLSAGKFSNVQWEFSGDTEYCIFSADEYDSDLFSKIKKENRLELVKRFEAQYAWCELYKINR